MRKPTLCICGNKGADQLHSLFQLFSLHRSYNRYLLNPKFQASSIIIFSWDLVGNHEGFLVIFFCPVRIIADFHISVTQCMVRPCVQSNKP